MKKIIIKSIQFALLVISYSSMAAEWTNWSNFSTITGMAQQGNTLWVTAHGGIARIDLSTQQPTYYTMQNAALPSLMMEDVAVSRSGSDVWIGTYDNGLLRASGGTFTQYPYPSGVSLYRLAVDAQGIVWCATNAGLYKFTNQAFTAVNVPLQMGTWDLSIFPNGKLLIGGSVPVVFDPATGRSFAPNTKNVFAYSSSKVAVSDDSTYYFAADHGGMLVVHDTTATVITDTTTVSVNSLVPLQLIALPSSHLLSLTMDHELYEFNGTSWAASSYSTKCYTSKTSRLFQDANATLLMGAVANGCSVQSLSNNRTNISLRKFAIGDNSITGIYRKSINETWVVAASEIGLYSSVSHRFVQVDTLSDIVYAITNWNGLPTAIASSALYQWNGSAWIRNSAVSLSRGNIYSADTDSAGNLYIATDYGLTIINGTNIYQYTSGNTPLLMNNALIRKLHYDHTRNILWMASAKWYFEI